MKPKTVAKAVSGPRSGPKALAAKAAHSKVQKKSPHKPRPKHEPKPNRNVEPDHGSKISTSDDADEDADDVTDAAADAGEDVDAEDGARTAPAAPENGLPVRRKKGKVFADQSKMLELIDSINSKEEQSTQKKVERVNAINLKVREREKKIQERKSLKRQKIEQVKAEILSRKKKPSSKPEAPAEVPKDQKPKKTVKFQ
ncbi:uncharacterized protein BJ171DRAFT_214821 [Polychytrium aggregatum]|uniref:uncharacterized protein n=1 Tax=Polychytrium aggregatum TaxID=110093 RepID=UPI0022FF08F7|nr:uncharacterized protein BJ171DRAFT_214821 [Polychytrium aggregatum]KAI9199505.1 hypothetical protein BJ171DRAFT_214821 [Polychytrium aggregatum]